jgi:hypothetical protein
MAGAWHVDVHTGSLAALLNAAELVSAVFGLRVTSLTIGETLRTSAGRFQVERVSEAPEFAQVVLVTGAPALQARLGMTARKAVDGGYAVLLQTSVHPRSWVGRLYFRAIQPFHYALMEMLLLPRVRKRARAKHTAGLPSR